MSELAVMTFGYLTGSIPFALLVARRRGIDLRQKGSGNIGAANVLRTSGVASGLLALCLDAAKGAAAVLVVQRFSADPAAPVASGLASILGHAYPVWLRFRGGKGVATAGGVFVVLSPVGAAAAAAIFVATVWITRYVSAGSMAAAATLAVTTTVLDVPASVTLGSVVAAAIIVYRHRGNLGRLMAGTERRVGQRFT